LFARVLVFKQAFIKLSDGAFLPCWVLAFVEQQFSQLCSMVGSVTQEHLAI
jgi:hypothetical protein